jgi:hypothetical protein
MKPKAIILTGLCAISALTLQAQTDSLLIAKGDTLNLGNKYTVAVSNLQLSGSGSEAALKIVRPYATSSGTIHYYGTTIHFLSDRIYAYNSKDTTVLASGLSDGTKAHSYCVVRYLTSLLRFYRDGVLLATTRETTMPETEGYIALYGTSQLKNGYNCYIASQTDNLDPDEQALETNIGNMLPTTYGNLAPDPYCNKGFTCDGLNASTRSFFANGAAFTGWGPAASMDSENAFSGPYCIRLEGQAVYPSQGASLDQPVSFASGATYLVRAMVRSNGYEGKLAITGESNYIHITDTGDKWAQVEGLLSTSAVRTNLYLNNADFQNSGTLYVDNFEVYKGYTSTASIPSTVTSVSTVPVSATQTWSPTKPTHVYMLGLSDNGTNYSKIDTAKVKVDGTVYLTKTVKGSQMYSMYFPGALTGIGVTGSYDGHSYTDAPLTLGLDYVLQSYKYPNFSYLNAGDDVPQGCYIIQFVDNLEGLDVTLHFAKSDAAATSGSQNADAAYELTGNPYYCDYTPSGSYLKFDETTQRYMLVSGQALKPLEAYIRTSVAAPVYQIVPGDPNRILLASRDNDGSRLSIMPVSGGIVVTALADGTLPIYTLSGQMIQRVNISAGTNRISLPKGLYVAGNKKFCIVR